MGRKRVFFESILAISIILLIFFVYVMVSGYAFTTTETRSTVKWNASGNNTIYYILDGNDGTLRALMNGSIYGINSNGSVMWGESIPDKWWVGSKYFKPAVDVGPDGTLYVYLRANVTMAAIERRLPYRYAGEHSMDMDDYNKRLMNAYAGTDFARSLDERVLALSPNGDLLWMAPLSTGLYDADICVRNGTVYVYHGYREAAISDNGTVLWDIGDVGADPVVDEAGYVYTVEPVHYSGQGAAGGGLSSVVHAYYPNGTEYWRRDIGQTVVAQPMQDGQTHTPFLDHGTLYLPLSSGLAVMSVNGSVKWTMHCGTSTALFALAPFDSDGNIYLATFEGRPGLSEYTVGGETYYAYSSDSTGYPAGNSNLLIMRPNGTVLANMAGPLNYTYAADGVAYRADVQAPGGPRTLGGLEPAVLTAIDLKGNRTMWSYDFNLTEAGSTLVNESNIKGLLSEDDVKSARTFNDMNANSYRLKPYGVFGGCSFRVVQGKDVTYVGFWTYNYDTPAIYDVSRVAYAGGLYAFDRSGRPLWSRPLDAMISSIYEKDGTVYYSTGSGRISAAHTDFVTGLAMAAALYLFIRFIMVGAISRARGAINKNENRNAVLRYIVDNPGSTMYEISRSLGINKGTVRYHLFILGVNHRIASHKADKKFVRYFPNSNTYSGIEQHLMSLLRRDPMRNVIVALLRKPGLSNVELSKELNIPESAMSKHMKELYARGIVDKRRISGGVSYSIKEEFRGSIAKTLERIGS